MTRLAVENLGVDLGSRRVIENVSFAVGKGEFVGLVGPNGAGKSTLLRALCGLLPVDGAVMLDGKSAVRMAAGERAFSMAFLPQERDVAWNISVEALVMLGRSPHLSAFSAPGPDDRAAVDAAIARLNLDAFRQRPVTELSGGERARVLIARALAQETPLLLADEPTAGLDPAHNLGVMALFADLAREGRSVIASTHDLGLAAAHCSRLILLDHGGIVADGAPADVLTPERLRTVYFVETYIGEADGQMIVQPVALAGTGKS